MQLRQEASLISFWALSRAGSGKACIAQIKAEVKSRSQRPTDAGANRLSESAVSKNGVPIFLTDERWRHILDGHPEMARRRQRVMEAVAAPDRVLEGNTGERMAIKKSGVRGWLVVVYKESAVDGFVLTAFRTTRLASLDRRRQLWP